MIECKPVQACEDFFVSYALLLHAKEIFNNQFIGFYLYMYLILCSNGKYNSQSRILDFRLISDISKIQMSIQLIKNSNLLVFETRQLKSWLHQGLQCYVYILIDSLVTLKNDFMRKRKHILFLQ